jgi:transcriptional regulator with XRE-family HTH domain
MADNRSTSPPSPGIVGPFLREKREAVGLSQRALGLLFDPPVTTQFISNIERGVTPLPPVHVSTLVRVLHLTETELLGVLEREYAAKISNRVGRPELALTMAGLPGFRIADEDRAYFQAVYDSYRQSDPKTRDAFQSICDTLLRTPKPHAK